MFARPPPFKRKAESPPTGSSAPSGKKMSFAERMMAKMGHVAGQGLGREGAGMVKPIEVKVRPVGAGLGTVREMTDQAKEERKRQAERKGEEYLDSSEEERREEKKRRERRKIASGEKAAPGFIKPKKKKVRTVAEIENDTEGFHVPAVLKSIIDATGSETKLLTSTAGLMSGTGALPRERTKKEKLAARARIELEAYADQWKKLEEEKKRIDEEEEHLNREIQELQEEVDKEREIVEATEKVLGLTVEDGWEKIVSFFQQLRDDLEGNIHESSLSELLIAVIHPLFKNDMQNWDPLENPTLDVLYLEQLRPMLLLPPTDYNIEEDEYRKTSTPYESLIYSVWRTQVHSTITNDWNPHDPTPLVALFEAWKPILPPFIYHEAVNTFVARKLSTAVENWNPRKRSQPLPHTYIFDWLPYLAPYHTDPSVKTSLVHAVSHKLKTQLSSLNIDSTNGPPPYLTPWLELLGPHLKHRLNTHLLPKLASYLSGNLVVDPLDQDMAPLDAVLSWSTLFPIETIARLLATHFGPPWLTKLHEWLTSPDADHSEVQTWINWWENDVFPPALSHAPDLQEHVWGPGHKLFEQAISLGAQVDALPPPAPPTELLTTPAPPARAHARPSPAPATPPVAAQARATGAGEAKSFRDTVEEFCEANGLLLIALREAHLRKGLPLFRITASVTGRGGVVAYFEDGLVWVRKKKGGEETWLPMGVGEDLVHLAEGSAPK